MDEQRLAIFGYLTAPDGDGWKAVALWELSRPMVDSGVRGIITAATLEVLRDACMANLAQAREIVRAQQEMGDPLGIRPVRP